MEPAFAACRAVQFGAALLLFGISFYRAVLPRGLELRGTDTMLRRALIAAAALALATLLAWFLFTAAGMAGSASAMTDPATLRLVLTQTDFGALWLWRSAFIVALTAAVFLERSSRRPFTVVLSALFLASLSLTGHAAAGTGWPGALHRIADAVHLLCAGIWLGGLFVLTSILPAAALPVARIALSRFSAIAIPAVALVIATGAANALFILPGWSAFVSRYGVLLLFKIALAAAMVALGLLNRLVFVPNVEAGDAASASHLVRSAAGEIALGAAVLVIVGVLGITPPA